MTEFGLLNENTLMQYTGIIFSCKNEKKVQVGKDQEKAQSEKKKKKKNSHSKNRGGKKPN